MHIDARTIDSGSSIEGDICIIGAGAAGISMALEWINTPYKIILVEGGGFQYDPDVQELYAGKTTGQHYYPLKSARLHYFGGTTGHWAGFCSTFDEIDFMKRDWVPHSGWPISRKELDPFYARAQKNPELGPYEYGLAYWQKQDPEMVPLPFDEKVVWNKIWQFSPPTRFGDKYRDAIVKAKNIHLYTYANVTDIKTNDRVSSVTEVTVKNHAGKTHQVKAKYFVLACCSIQNARLLLAANSRAPKGLGNDNDNVGRYFMEHLEIKSAELYLAKPNPMKLYMLNWGVTKARAELAITKEKQEEYKILNGTVSLAPSEFAKNMKPMIDIWKDDDPRRNADSLISSLQKAARQISRPGAIANKDFELFTRIEQAPNPESRVTLDTEKDALGMPRATLHWELTDFEKRSIRKIYGLLGQQVGIAGVGRVKLMEYLEDENDHSWPSFTGGGWHHMGTTRMSDDPKNGVVDADCKVHGISNLFTAGASNYVTAAAPNPTLTLIALTLRLSDHLKQKISGK
ncbi:MAG TPA: GMC family oxidoreductase [Chitinophagaceae bacterium]